MSERAIVHLEALRDDARSEIKQRIGQRDKYSVQMTLALGAIVGIGFASPSESIVSVLIAAPLVSIYFTTLILYSYRIHRLLARYLRESLEPELARVCGTSIDLEWETFYAEHSVPGIRRTFFLAALWVTCLAAPAYLWLVARDIPNFDVALGFLTPVYVLSAAAVTRAFWSG